MVTLNESGRANRRPSFPRNAGHPLFVSVLCSVLASGCRPDSPPGYHEQNVRVSQETLKPYTALFSVDRQKLGFPPLPTNGTVRILTVDRARWRLEYAPPNYDVSFQFYGGSSSYPYWSRFVALKSTNGGYNLVSEQMTFNGPKRYLSDETMINESISILNETEQVAVHGTNIAGTVIDYRGPDQRFGKGRFPFSVDGLQPSDIGPVLREWGYAYAADKAQPDGPANRSQPIRSETNRPPAPAGSGR